MSDGPLLVAVKGERESVEELEACFLNEAVELADRWLTRLPVSSRWYAPCVTVRRTAVRALGRRPRGLAALP